MSSQRGDSECEPTLALAERSARRRHLMRAQRGVFRVRSDSRTRVRQTPHVFLQSVSRSASAHRKRTLHTDQPAGTINKSAPDPTPNRQKERLAQNNAETRERRVRPARRSKETRQTKESQRVGFAIDGCPLSTLLLCPRHSPKIHHTESFFWHSASLPPSPLRVLSPGLENLVRLLCLPSFLREDPPLDCRWIDDALVCRVEVLHDPISVAPTGPMPEDPLLKEC